MTDAPRPARVLEEVADLTAGFTVAALPFLITAVPGIALFVVLPALLLGLVLAVPAIVVALLAAPPYLVWRAVRRRPQKL